MTFSTKILSFSFSLQSGNFAGGGNSYNSGPGLRASAEIQKFTGTTRGKGNFRIYGLPLSVMNQLTTVGANFTKRYNNKITVSAGDSEMGLSVVYIGDIMSAYVDAQGMPDVAFVVECQVGVSASVMPATPISFAGQTQVATIAQKIAGLMGFQFQNSGVNTTLSNPYYWGSPRRMLLALAKHAGFEHTEDKNTVAIWPSDGSRSGGGAMISPQTGLIGFPMFDQASVIVRCYYNPNIDIGQTIQIQSSLTAACGSWKVNEISYALDAVTKGGRWEMIVKAIYVASGTTPTT